LPPTWPKNPISFKALKEMIFPFIQALRFGLMVSILIFKAKRSSDELIAPCAEKGSLKIEAGVYLHNNAF
jgi:hypothetical protein